MRSVHKPFVSYLQGGIQRGVTPDVVEAHVLSAQYAREIGVEEGILRRSVSGEQIKRFGAWRSDQSIIYLTRHDDIRDFPNAFQHVEQYRKRVTCPEVRDKKHPWWSLHRARDPQIFASPKFIGLTTSRNIAVIHDSSDGLVVTDAMYVFSTKPGIDPWATMAVLHSRAFLFLYHVSNQGEARVIPQVKASKLEPLPFPDLTTNQPLVQQLSNCCAHLIRSSADIVAALTDRDRDYHERRFAELDGQVEDIVSELYQLSSVERSLIDETLATRKVSKKRRRRAGALLQHTDAEER